MDQMNYSLQKLEMKQFQVKDWPDTEDTPHSTTGLLCVLEEAEAWVRGHGGGPIIVHCRYGYHVCYGVSWRRPRHGCGDMEQDPSSYTAGMDTVFATVCPGGSSDLGTGILSRDHHRALQVWIRCLLLCVLEEATARVR